MKERNLGLRVVAGFEVYPQQFFIFPYFSVRKEKTIFFFAK
jgi:hypothetical protein